RYVTEAAATAGALLLVAVGEDTLTRAGDALRELAPTVGFLAALLLIAEGAAPGGRLDPVRGALVLIAEGARREGLFDGVGALIARGSRGSARRLLAFVFVVAAGVTAL